MMLRGLIMALVLSCGAVRAETLRIGTEPDYPPYATLGPDGQLTGFDIDLANLICARGGFDCEWTVMTFGHLVGAVAKGRIDIAIAGMADTPARRGQVDFSRGYRPAAPGYAAFAALTPGLSAEGLLAGVQAGTIQADFLSELGHRHRTFADTATMIAALRSGDVDAIFGSVGSIDRMIETTEPGLRIIEMVAVDNYDTAIAISRDVPGLTARINALIDAIEADGTLQDLETRWFPVGESL